MKRFFTKKIFPIILTLLFANIFWTGYSYAKSSPGSDVMQAPQAKWSLNTMIDNNFPILDYASDDKVVFHGYFGLFVYDLKTSSITDSLDLKALGCQNTQAASPCKVTVSKTGDTIWLQPSGATYAYAYNLANKNLVKSKTPLSENTFKNMVLTKAIPQKIFPLKTYRCSKNTVPFGDGSYGYLYINGQMLTGISYIRGDMQWNIFTKKDCKYPDLIKQDDSFYNGFYNQGKSSADSLFGVYNDMLLLSDYAGVCKLSKGVNYSDDLQKEWKKVQLTPSGKEMKKKNGRACYIIYITASDPLPSIGLVKGKNEKYLYLVQGKEGWYADGALHDAPPSDNWWKGSTQ